MSPGGPPSASLALRGGPHAGAPRGDENAVVRIDEIVYGFLRVDDLHLFSNESKICRACVASTVWPLPVNPERVGPDPR